MKVIVCIKRVPDSEARIQVAASGREIDLSGVKFVMNPYDEFALEAGIRLRESGAASELIALTLGGSEAGETLRAALAMGADRALLLRSEEPTEGLATAKAIAAELRVQQPDLVLCGMKAIDDDLHAVGPMLAELLERPAISGISDFSLEEGRVRAEREIDGRRELVEMEPPCILTITKGAHEPRYPSLKGIMAARRKPLEEKSIRPEPSRIRIVSLTPPPERQPGRVLGEGPECVPELVRLLREEAQVI